MANILAPCTWEMTAAQIVTPTTSQLATVNAIQTAVATSSSWTVNATGTSTAGFKWVELKPSNTSSDYKDYRILVVERVNTATNKTFHANDGGAFNSASYIYFTFAPDGGAAHVTFTIANLETSSDVYVGTRYKSGTSTVWETIAMPCTALWLYLCEGAFWLINRSAATSHITFALGNIFVPTGFSDYNALGVEWCPPGHFKRSGITSATLVGTYTGYSFFFWNGSGTSARTWNNTYTFAWTFQGQVTTGALTIDALAGANSSMTFPQIMVILQISGSSGNLMIFRGLYWKVNVKTRTTITSNGVNAGYTFYPDDANLGTTLAAYAFMNG